MWWLYIHVYITKTIAPNPIVLLTCRMYNWYENTILIWIVLSVAWTIIFVWPREYYLLLNIFRPPPFPFFSFPLRFKTCWDHHVIIVQSSSQDTWGRNYPIYFARNLEEIEFKIPNHYQRLGRNRFSNGEIDHSVFRSWEQRLHDRDLWYGGTGEDNSC